MYESALESLRGEVAVAEVEIKEYKLTVARLEAKVKEQPKRADDSSNMVSSEVVNAEILSLQSAIKYLNSENRRLKSQLTNQYSELPDLTTKTITQTLNTHKQNLINLREEVHTIQATVSVVHISDGEKQRKEWQEQAEQRLSKLASIKYHTAQLRNKIGSPIENVPFSSSAVLVGKVTLPGSSTVSKTIPAVVNSNQLHELQTIFVN